MHLGFSCFGTDGAAVRTKEEFSYCWQVHIVQSAVWVQKVTKEMFIIFIKNNLGDTLNLVSSGLK